MKDREIINKVPGSFRDPSGFLFNFNDQLYRQINLEYKEDYECFIQSGLYQKLVDKGYLVPHAEVDIESPHPQILYKIIKPEFINFISYPYEWCFSQLKAAAKLTLQIQMLSLDAGMSLKDCSAYNIQFINNNPVFIDTISFEKYVEGQPWVGYRQFCQHFLAPLALMCYRDIRLNQLLRIFIDGIPLDLASSLLPYRSRFSLPLLAHIHLHAGSQLVFNNKKADVSRLKLSRRSLDGIIIQLEHLIDGLKWSPKGTEWVDYYSDNNYSSDAIDHKKTIVKNYISSLNPHVVWDLGANVGLFSRIASAMGIQTIAFDVDPGAVERNYLDCLRDTEKNILPLVMDFTNPSPAIGWLNKERSTLFERSPADAVMALALVHHLAISNNVPFDRMAEFFRRIGKSLIIEFIPKTDSQVRRMLANRVDVFHEYNQSNFEKVFSESFEIVESIRINDSERTIYLMR